MKTDEIYAACVKFNESLSANGVSVHAHLLYADNNAFVIGNLETITEVMLLAMADRMGFVVIPKRAKTGCYETEQGK
jgi:hypothetical protein